MHRLIAFAISNRRARSGRIPEVLQADLACPDPAEKIFPFSAEANQSHLRNRLTHRGADRDRHERGLGCGGRGSVGRAGRRRADRTGPRANDRARRTNGASTPFFKTSDGSTWPAEAMMEVAAYGEVVWSWHPLLMSSSWMRAESYRISSALHPRATVTRGIRRRGELEGNR
jgi:hypothetical protein